MSFNRLLIVSAFILLVSVFAGATVATAAFPGSNADFPSMPAGASAGSITGKAYKTVTTDAVPYVYVAIVNAANTSKIYLTTTTDDTGRFRFNGIPSTGGGAAYRLIARGDGYYDGATEPFAVPSGSKVFVDVQILPNPNAVTGPTGPVGGDVGGKITEAGSNSAIPSATIELLTPEYNVYESTTTNLVGVYRLTGLTDYNTSFIIKVSKDGYMPAMSPEFKIYEDAMIDINVVLVPIPAEVTPTPTASPTTDGSQTGTPQSAPGFEAALVFLAIAIVVAVAWRRN